jgi:MFS family permease
MMAGAGLLVAGLLLGLLVPSWSMLLPLWMLLGLGNGLVLTPSWRLLRRSAHAGDRRALFAAQFALSHACWLIAYPVAGRFRAAAGMEATFLVLAALGAVGLIAALVLWPTHDADQIEHAHDRLPPGHAHLGDTRPDPTGALRHRHAFVIDELRWRWLR